MAKFIKTYPRPPKKYRCNKCKKIFGNRKAVRLHLRQTHKVHTSKSVDPRRATGTLKDYYEAI